MLITSERAIEEGLLPPVRLAAYGVPDLAEENANFDARFLDVAEQGFAEGAVASRRAIIRRGVVSGGVGDRSVALRLDPSQALGNRSFRTCRPRHARDKRVIAAGIQDDKAELGGGVHLCQHGIERHTLERHIGITSEPDVDGDEIVGAVHFDPMAGIIHNGPVCPGDQIAEIRKGLDHLRAIEIVVVLDRETEFPQRCGHSTRVVAGIGEDVGMSIVAVADDEGHALAGRMCGGRFGLVQSSQSRQGNFLPLARVGGVLGSVRTVA